jgi:ubiquinone/menaquinone biosynthesis C-methylase UbiE
MTSEEPGVAHRHPALHYLAGIRRFWNSHDNDFIVELAAPNPTDRLLDIGAGMGPAVMAAAAKVPAGVVLGVEPSRLMRTALQLRRGISRHRKRIKVLDGTAEALPIDSGSIDTVWSVNTLHHWSDLEQGAAEVMRVLKPGGAVMLIDGDFEHPDHTYQQSGRTDHDHLFVDLHRVRVVLEQVGFADIESLSRLVGETPVKMTTARKPQGIT